MSELKDKVDRAAEMLHGRLAEAPAIGIVLGTGLGDLARQVEDAAEIPYEEIPDFPRSTVESHAGQLVSGRLAGKPVVMMEGRFHLYEGYSFQEVTFPVRVMKALGAKALVVTNACGGINPQYEKGDILVIEDHINLLPGNPLIGPNDEALGPRFPDMYAPYDPDFLRRAEDIALRERIRTQRGVYAAMSGPCLETRAEYRMLKILGADAIGMSTVPEVIVAVHAGLRTLGMGVITDLCLPDALEPVKIEEIIAVANEAGPKLARIIAEFVKEVRL